MNYDNITKENFNEYLEAFNESLFNINFFLFENENEDNNEINFEVDYEDTDPEIIELYKLKKNGLSFKEDLKTVFNLFDIRFKKLFKFSHNNDIFFEYCSFKVYENTFENRFKDFENKFIDVQKIEFVKKEVETILNSIVFRFNMFSIENQTILKNAKIKKTEFLQSISKDFNFNIIKRDESDLLNFNKYKVEVKTVQLIQAKNNDIFKSPQDSIEAYLYDEINIELYEDFSIHFKTETELLQFFNNLFNEFEFFSNNINNYVEITNHFVFLDMGYLFWTDEIHFNHKTEHEKLFELFNLYDCLTILIQFHFPENKRTGIQIKTCEYIIKLGQKIQKLYLPELQKEVSIKTEPTQPEADTSTVKKNSFINNFDNVHESKVIEYFTKNLVDKKYITVDVLNEYLKQAFELKQPPKQRFSFTKLNTQGKIKIVFYEYFKITAGKPIGRKKEYVELLGEYFTGFDTSKLMTNFSK